MTLKTKMTKNSRFLTRGLFQGHREVIYGPFMGQSMGLNEKINGTKMDC